MKKHKREMPLINFKGIIGKFVSLDMITNNYYADNMPYFTVAEYELKLITKDGYEVSIKPIKEDDANRIICCLRCVSGKIVKCWRDYDG